MRNSSSCVLSLHAVNLMKFLRLSTILISRFMMNLQEARQVALESTGVNKSISLVQFDRAVGSIGVLLGSSILDDDVAVE